MNWDDFRVVLEVGRHGSVSGAARALSVDQSTVGRRLTALERRLGIILFVRSRSGFRPTDAGNEVLAHAEAMERKVSGLTARLAATDLNTSGFVRIVSNPWIISHVLVPAYPDFRAVHRSVEVRFIGDTRGRSIAKREADIALWFEIDPGDTEMSFDVAEVPYAVFAPAGADPSKLHWVSFWDDTGVRAPMRWLNESRRPGEYRVMTATDAVAILQAIRAGVGKGLIPIWLAHGDERVERVDNDSDKPVMTRKLSGHCHPDIFDQVRVKAVITWLRAAFASRMKFVS